MLKKSELDGNCVLKKKIILKKKIFLSFFMEAVIIRDFQRLLLTYITQQNDDTFL